MTNRPFTSNIYIYINKKPSSTYGPSLYVLFLGEYIGVVD